jgi:hypothetical protein
MEIFRRYLEILLFENVKGTVPRHGYFLKVCADEFQGLLIAFCYPIQLFTFDLLL